MFDKTKERISQLNFSNIWKTRNCNCQMGKIPSDKIALNLVGINLWWFGGEDGGWV